jgi:hypothetical protein
MVALILPTCDDDEELKMLDIGVVRLAITVQCPGALFALLPTIDCNLLESLIIA